MQDGQVAKTTLVKRGGSQLHVPHHKYLCDNCTNSRPAFKMAPDIEELISKVNSLTLDKNRLRQKLAQLSQQQQKHSGGNVSVFTQSLSAYDTIDKLLESSSQSLGADQTKTSNVSTTSSSSGYQDATPVTSKAATAVANTDQNNSIESSRNTISGNLIAGIECNTSCEDDFVYINRLLKKQLDEMLEKWDYLQSKCSAHVSELHALQERYAILAQEKLDLEDKYAEKCSEHDKTVSELRTIVLNYETQLSAMSEHLSMITSQVNLGDDLARAQRQLQ